MWLQWRPALVMRRPFLWCQCLVLLHHRIEAQSIRADSVTSFDLLVDVMLTDGCTGVRLLRILNCLPRVRSWQWHGPCVVLHGIMHGVHVEH